MNSNFQIFEHRNSDNLHLKLIGDFDDSSAHELIDVIEKKSNNFINIYVHTSNLKEIFPSGIDIFHQDMNRIKNIFGNIKFTGMNANEIAFNKKCIY